MKHIILIFLISMNIFSNHALSNNLHPSSFEEALNLIHAYGGSGSELNEAFVLINDLSESHPNSGYAETLSAEILSTWRLSQNGTPVEVRRQIIELADYALRINPGLAQAHVAKGRALLRSSMYDEAISELEIALVLEPDNSSAAFIQAEIFRRMDDIVRADIWYKKFINLTPNNARKSNGYYWLGKGYQDAAWKDSISRGDYTRSAREAYEKMIELDPMHAWKNVNFSIFLNGYAADFDAAEEYAQRALDIMNFRMARFHLAAARYQKLLEISPSMDSTSINENIREIELSTKIPLREALEFTSFSSVVRNRLTMLILKQD